MPMSLLGERFGLEVHNRGTPGESDTSVSTWQGREIGRLLLPSEPLEALIRGIGRTPGRRIWIADQNGLVLARGGNLARNIPAQKLNPLIALLFRPPNTEVLERESAQSLLTGPEVDSALQGVPASRWREASQEGTYVVSATHPIWMAQSVVGLVMIEEANFGIQTVRRKALGKLLNQTLLFGLGGILILLFFAIRLSSRLTRLRNETDNAIDPQGRVIGTLRVDQSSDEIGHLSRSFAAMVGTTEWIQPLPGTAGAAALT